jgi:hypothetical protein
VSCFPRAKLPRSDEWGLGDPLARPPAAEELGKRRSGEAVHRNRAEQRQYGLTFAHLDVRHLLEEADVPAGGGALVLLRLLVSKEKGELECSASPTNPSSEAADRASVTFSRSSARRKRM